MTVYALRSPPIDLDVYRAGARVLLDGTSLYQRPLATGLYFTYPPLAAIVLVPWALLPAMSAQIVMDATNLALLFFVCRRSLIAVGVPAQRLLVGTSFAAGLLFWLDPVRTSVYLGQVNLVLLALVLWDLLGDENRRIRGIGVGIAAGIKLTPLIFIPFLFATRQFRAAITATITFAGTILVGFLVAPHDAADYWLRGFFVESARVFPDLGSPHNQSLLGLVSRLGAPRSVWLVLAVCLFAGTLIVAVRCGDRLLAITLCGLAGAAVSPYSWNHHWVYLVPLAICVGRELLRGNRYWLAPAVAMVLALPWIANLANPPNGGPPVVGGPLGVVLGNGFLLIYVLALACSAWHVQRSPH